MREIAISLLSVEHKKRTKMVNKLLAKGMKWVHYDLMDGKFVPNMAISIEEMQEIVKKSSPHVVEAHFMVNNPIKWIEASKNFIDYATFHFEAVKEEEIKEIIKKYKGSINIGIAINPKTNPKKVEHLLPNINHILVMSVEPGKSGQNFKESALKKIEFLKKKIQEKKLVVSIGIDGGINNLTGPLAIQAGANILVSGSYLANNPTKKTLDEIETIK